MSKISRKHQVTLPVSVLREAGIGPGDEVVLRVVGRGRIEIERASDIAERFAGALPTGTYPPRYLDTLRDEWHT